MNDSPLKVFYSWQSDLPAKTGRTFIQDALKRAIRQLNRNMIVEESAREDKCFQHVILDHDTKGVRGTPDLASTIFQKISTSDVFIADISFVGKNSVSQRSFSNPNVLIELGFALGVLTGDKILLVMDTQSGKFDELPFDLRHKRFPIAYSSASDLAVEKKRLAETFASALAPFVSLHQPLLQRRLLTEEPSFANLFAHIMESDSVDDWHRTRTNDWVEIACFKSNVNLRFEIHYDENGTQNENFVADWANCYPSKSAKGYFVQLRFGSTLIDTFVLVSVDGGRALLPVPKPGTLKVPPVNFKIAQIFDSGSLIDYFFRSGLSLQYEQ